MSIDFSRPVAPGGYAWWYVDAVSDDGAYGLTLIAFIGSVFSPYYRLARRGRAADPANHCALNVALYGRTARWAMTERNRRHLRRDAATLGIGPSHMAWDRATLSVTLDERGMPLPRRLRGSVRVHPHVLPGATYHLDAARQHRWTPIAPLARVEVTLHDPPLRWSGLGYLDSNEGDVPLEDSFLHWTWSRAALPDGAAILYDVARTDGTGQNLSLRIHGNGDVADLHAPHPIALPRTRWRLPRGTRSEADAQVARTYTDAPFYARSLLRTRLAGQDVEAMHESLSLTRFTNPLTQLMLPFRMPRALR